MAENAPDGEIENPYEVNPCQRRPDGVKILPAKGEVHEQRHNGEAEDIADIGFGALHGLQGDQYSLVRDTMTSIGLLTSFSDDFQMLRARVMASFPKAHW